MGWDTCDKIRKADIAELVGLEITSFPKHTDKVLILCTSDGGVWSFQHIQDCCEIVEIVDIVGDLADLIGAPLLVAEERCSQESLVPEIEEHFDRGTFTWTFYEFATIKGSVTVRWLGRSNGFYSEKVYFFMHWASS